MNKNVYVKFSLVIVFDSCLNYSVYVFLLWLFFNRCIYNYIIYIY